MNNVPEEVVTFEYRLEAVLVRALSRETNIDNLNNAIIDIRSCYYDAIRQIDENEISIAELRAENIRLQENINVLIQLSEANNDQRTV